MQKGWVPEGNATRSGRPSAHKKFRASFPKKQPISKSGKILFCHGGQIMTRKQAIHILMLSPCYWLLDLSARNQLIREYRASFEAICCRNSDSEKRPLRV
jgi:hypothetical protein